MQYFTFALSLAGLVLMAAHAADAPPIYRCARDGTAVYSDRPCAVDAAVHEADDSRVTVYEAPPISSRASPSGAGKTLSHKPRSARKTAENHQLQRAKCAKLAGSLRDVRSKMRSGYGVKEGERLKARQRQLTQQLRSENCS